MRLKQIAITFLLFLFSYQTVEAQSLVQNENVSIAESWWPDQPTPNGIVRVDRGATHGEDALLYSLAGLVAKVHKEGEMDELVWINGGGSTYDDKWYNKVLQRTGAEERATLNVWELLDRYKDEDFIDGYILYSPEDNAELRSDMDFSYNIAVSYAGAKNGLVIDPTLESDIKELGYSKLIDARNISREQYFDSLKSEKNQNLIVTMNPVFHNNMDFAIANNAFVAYDADSVTEEIMEWVNPISPVVGWNAVNEGEHTLLATVNGLFNTASDWSHNLILLSAGAEETSYEKVRTIDPDTLDYNKEGHFHSFIMSDGDNIQWTVGNFIENTSYWGSYYHGDFPVGFGNPAINLSLIAPDVLDEVAITKPKHTSVIEYGPGGYHYPDRFAENREDSEAIKREFARKIGAQLQKTGVNLIGFIAENVTSNEAIDAYKIYAQEIEGLAGMFAVDFNPYHGGGGEVFWVENKDGEEIPVVTAKYSLWKNLCCSRGGNPEEISSIINEDVSNATSPTMDWTVVHAWSEFENPSNNAHKAKGVQPVMWTIDMLDKSINVVSPEELIWRIRDARKNGNTTEDRLPTDSENLVTNHNFSSDTADFAGWNLLGELAGEAYELQESPNDDGQMVVYFTDADYHPSDGVDNIELLANSMPVTGGVEYTAKALVRTWDGPEGTLPSNMKLRFFSEGEEEGQFNFEGEGFVDIPGNTNGEWQLLEIVLTAPEAADVADIVFDTFGSAGEVEAEINLDAVYLAETTDYTVTVSNEQEDLFSDVPKQIQLQQNYPNPFNPATQIQFTLSQAGNVTLEVYTILGQRVSTLVNERMNAGEYQFKFDGSNLPSGLYLYRLNTENYSEVRKMSLIK